MLLTWRRLLRTNSFHFISLLSQGLGKTSVKERDVLSQECFDHGEKQPIHENV